MSETTLTELSRTEATVLQSFIEFSLSYKNDRYGVRAALASETTDKADDGDDAKNTD